MKRSVPPLTLIRSDDPARAREARDGRPGGARPELDDGTLARAQRGDADACRALVRLYEQRVFAVVGRTLGAPLAGRVEDVCQETFLRVFRALPSFVPRGAAPDGAALSTWIFTIALRLCFDELRRHKRALARLRSAPLDARDARAPDLTEPLAEQRALQRRLERALDELPEDMRATFVLRVVAELSVADTARALHVDEGTVKSRLSRARDRLRVALGAGDGA